MGTLVSYITQILRAR